MSREEASRRLERLPNGTYLIRVSQSDLRRGEYALSIKYVADELFSVINAWHCLFSHKQMTQEQPSYYSSVSSL